MNQKQSENSGQLTAAKQVNSRVMNNESSYGHLSVSETSHSVMQREAANRPESEDIIRGIRPAGFPIRTEVIAELRKKHSIKVIETAIRTGLLVVV